jgi:hypothetical protein
MQGKVIWTVSYNEKILAKQIITDILIQSVHKSKVLRPIVLNLFNQPWHVKIHWYILGRLKLWVDHIQSWFVICVTKNWFKTAKDLGRMIRWLLFYAMWTIFQWLYS